jgi:hypothetical protein
VTAPAVARRWREAARTSVVRGGSGLSLDRTAAFREQVVPLRRRAPLAALLATGLVVHAAVAPHFAIVGLAPDVLVVAVVAVAAVRGERAGAAFGFATGLGADVFLATPLGTSALAYTLLGHAVGRSSRPPSSTIAAALCSPTSLCFACRTGRHYRREPASTAETADRPTRLRRRAAARRANLRRSIALAFLGVAAGRLATAAAATTLGGLPFPERAGLLRIAGVAALSAPFGPPTLALVRRLSRPRGAPG